MHILLVSSPACASYQFCIVKLLGAVTLLIPATQQEKSLGFGNERYLLSTTHCAKKDGLCSQQEEEREKSKGKDVLSFINANVLILISVLYRGHRSTCQYYRQSCLFREH